MRFLLLVAFVVLAAGLTACEHQGPAERAGKSIDNAGQSISDTLNPPKGPVQAAGRKIDRATGD